MSLRSIEPSSLTKPSTSRKPALALFTPMPCCCTICGSVAVASCSLFCTCTWAMSGSVPDSKVSVTDTEPLESEADDM